MTAPLDSTGNPYVNERRNCGRQKALFSSVVISENNSGRVLNISPNGLALQTETELVGDEFPNFRFKFSPSLAWAEAKGRVAWRNSARNVVGIEFIDLTDEVQRQIRTWIDLKKDSTELSKPPVAAAKVNASLGEANAVLPNENTILTPQSTDLGTENRGEPPVFPPIQDPVEARVARPTFENSDIKNNAGGSTKTSKAVALALVVVVLLSVFFFQWDHSRKLADTRKTMQTAGALHTAIPAAQPPPVPSALHSDVNSPRPVPSAPSPAVANPNRKAGPGKLTYVLQVAAMVHEENANSLAASLRKMNFPAFVIRMPSERFHHVLVGPYDNADATRKVKSDLEKSGFTVLSTEWKVPTQ
jgi:cell division septation protein DedD